METEEKAFSHLGSKLLHLSSPSQSLTIKGEFCSLSLQGQVPGFLGKGAQTHQDRTGCSGRLQKALSFPTLHSTHTKWPLP